MVSPSLVGPPELYRSRETMSAKITGDAFMDLMVAEFNAAKGFTENRSPTLISSGNPCLDFFFHVVPDTPPSSLTERLRLAWAHNPTTALKLVCQLHAVRGTGKSDREGFYSAALWLHRHHPRTLASNVAAFAGFGCFKDLPEILLRLLDGPDVRAVQRAEWRRRKGRRLGRRNKKRWGRRKGKNTAIPKKIRVADAKERSKNEAEKARTLREERRIRMAEKVVRRYGSDVDFRRLHDKVSDHFAECLVADIGFLNAGEHGKISLASKWCPSIDSSFDRSTLLCESIAKRVFPRESFPEYEGVKESHYAYRVRDRLRKEVLVPLRKALELPEVYIGAGRWDQIPYTRVASVAMRLYKKRFMKHDGDRFGKYLNDVQAGKATIAAGALLPHEIIESMEDAGDSRVAELQWRRTVEDLSKGGKLQNCIAVSDVSGSMSGTPMKVSVALGVLLSELSEDPWRGKIVTFSREPRLHVVEGGDLREKIGFVGNMEWGMNTDFQKVFDLILRVAVNGGLREDQIVKRVFVFSDMEFDEASANEWETDYEAIVRKFSEKGYRREAVPEIVFWNLRDSRSVPVPAKEKGVALVSGFSKNLMKLFLDNGGEISPEAVMEAAISGEEYQRLVVVD